MVLSYGSDVFELGPRQQCHCWYTSREITVTCNYILHFDPRSLLAATSLVHRQSAVLGVRVQAVTVTDPLAEVENGCREERGAAQYQGPSLQRAHILRHGGRFQVLTRAVLGDRGPTVESPSLSWQMRLRRPETASAFWSQLCHGTRAYCTSSTY